MQFQYLSELGKEFKKYTGFMVPESVRAPSIEAMQLLQSENIELPINSTNSPVVIAFTNILTNAKTSKTAAPLIATMCNVVSTEMLQGNALSEILKHLENFASKIDMESCLKIIQIATMLVNSHFLEIKTFSSLLSLVLSFCVSPIEFVNNNAKAAFEQIISAFFGFSKTVSELSSMISNDIESVLSAAKENAEAKTFEFHREIDKLIFIIVNDITNICLQKTPTFFNAHKLPCHVAYEFLRTICLQQKETIISSKTLLELLSKALESSTNDFHNTDFAVCVIEQYVEYLPDECREVFSFYLSMLQKTNPNLIDGLMFFRTFIFKDQTVIVNFFKHCDTSGDLIQILVHDLLKLFEDEETGSESDLHISFVAKQMPNTTSSITKPSSNIEKCSSIEIAAFMIRAMFKANTQELEPLVLKIWADLLSILTLSLRCIDQSSSYILLQSLHFFIVLANDLNLDDPRGSAISALVNVVGESVSSYSETMRHNALNTVCAAIEGTPLVFKGHWSKIVNALSLYNTELSDLSFSIQIPDDHLIELELSLLSVRTASIGDTRQWALDFSLALLSVNISRFNQIWEKIKVPYNDQKNDSIEGFVGLLHDSINSETEESFCSSLLTFMEDENLEVETKMNLIDNVYTIISEESTGISKGWPSIIKCISPNNFVSSTELVNNGFRCLQILCTDILFSLDVDNQMLAFSIIFEFASQQVDINISLSALGLLWNIVSLAKTSDFWISILGDTMNIICDERPDVSICAVKTLFSLIMSNYQNLSTDVFKFLTERFIKMHDSDNSLRIGNSATQQLAIYETAHCVHILASYFTDVTPEFWCAISSAQEKFMAECTKKDVVCLGFQFYEEVFVVDAPESVRLFILDTIDRLADLYLERESPNSVIFGSFGRMIRNVLPNQKDRSPAEFERWVSLSDKLIFVMKCPDFLPPTVHKTFDAIDDVLPNTDAVTTILLKHLVKCAAYLENERLSEVAIDHITYISSQKIPDSQLPIVFILTEPLFKLKNAKQLLLNFIDKDINPQHDVELFSTALIELSNGEGEIAEKAALNVIKLFKYVSLNTKKTFIEVRKHSLTTLELIWSKFLDPRSELFEEDTSKNLCKVVLSYFGDEIRKCCEEDQLIHELKFIEQAKISPDVYPNLGVAPHIISLMPSIADLVLHPNEDVRVSIRSILLKLSEE